MNVFGRTLGKDSSKAMFDAIQFSTILQWHSVNGVPLFETVASLTTDTEQHEAAFDSSETSITREIWDTRQNVTSFAATCKYGTPYGTEGMCDFFTQWNAYIHVPFVDTRSGT
jgi:hypothetical protein